MLNFDEYIQQGKPQKREKGYAWQTVIRRQAVDDLKPSESEMMAVVGLKNRENFMEYSLNPVIKEGFVTMLYKPQSPKVSING